MDTKPSNLFTESIHHEQRSIYTVSELTAKIKTSLEKTFPFVWTLGEISNFRIPASGHFYFTLKDADAQINAVMFRGQNRNLKFFPEDGMDVIGLGRISVYEPRGTYQILFEYLEPKGIGALQVAFQQLKARLAEEGLFDEKHKKQLPFIPKKISILTSPTGAVVHDILKIINRRFQNIPIDIIPVKVQGEGAEKTIVSGINLLNLLNDSDVAILARGGGSLEDLHAFNSEDVARAVFSSKIPIVSAIGHETDYTIADFVADLRAPTPSAAAELIVPQKVDLIQRCRELSMTLKLRFQRNIEYLRNRLAEIAGRVIDPKKRIQDLRLRLDDYTVRLIRISMNRLDRTRERLNWRKDRLFASNPMVQLNISKEKLEKIKYNILFYNKMLIENKKHNLQEQVSRMNALSPTAILSRGYSITRTIPDARVVRSPEAVDMGQELEVMLAKGAIYVNVQGKTPKTGN